MRSEAPRLYDRRPHKGRRGNRNDRTHATIPCSSEEGCLGTIRQSKYGETVHVSRENIQRSGKGLERHLPRSALLTEPAEPPKCERHHAVISQQLRSLAVERSAGTSENQDAGLHSFERLE